MNITVFGSSSPVPEHDEYVQAMRLGKLLADAGHCVLTGGYMGTMEAVSRGAAEAGGQTIGVTCAEIERWRQAKANPWVKEERHFPTLRERLYNLVETCDAAMALPGGIGTLAEISIMWSQMQTNAMPSVPLILIGDAWDKTFHGLFSGQDSHIKAAHRELLTFAPDVDTAVSALQKALPA
jgi:uncharacterized protein (TIGR00730 family)